jgi:hypothetical protein
MIPGPSDEILAFTYVLFDVCVDSAPEDFVPLHGIRESPSIGIFHYLALELFRCVNAMSRSMVFEFRTQSFKTVHPR